MMKRFLLVLGVVALCCGASGTRWPVVVSAQGVPGDADGDGVPDAADCSPADARLSQPHTYYFDEDGDQYGRTADPIQVCAVTAFPGLVPWGGDPDDHNNTIFPAVVPKG